MQMITRHTPQETQLVIERLENTSETLFQWFSDNQMKVNPGKFYFLCGWDGEVSLTVENKKLKQ